MPVNNDQALLSLSLKQVNGDADTAAQKQRPAFDDQAEEDILIPLPCPPPMPLPYYSNVYVEAKEVNQVGLAYTDEALLEFSPSI